MTGGTKGTTASIMKHVKTTVGSTNTITLAVGETPAEGTTWVYDASDANMNTEIAVESVSTNTITVAETDEGTEVDVFYMTTVSDVYNINIKSTDFPKAFTVYGDTYMKTTDDDILPYLFKAYKCVPQSNISLSFANTGDPGTITITCDLLVDDDGNMLDLTLLPEEDESGE